MVELEPISEGLKNFEVERVKGIEPSWRVWKTRVLPLNYTRNRDAARILTTALALSIRPYIVFPQK